MGPAHQGRKLYCMARHRTVHVRHRRPKGLAIARWHSTWECQACRHKRLGWKQKPTYPSVSFPPNTTPPGSPNFPVVSGRPLTRNRMESSRGSGSHLTRAFAGSKPLHRPRPLLPLHTIQALILGDERLMGAVWSLTARSLPHLT
jgi:hypothetical protein